MSQPRQTCLYVGSACAYSFMRDRVLERPLEGGPEPRGLLFESLNRRSDFQKSRPPHSTVTDGRPLSSGTVLSIPFGQVTYVHVIFDVSLKQVPALPVDGLHDRALREHDSASLAPPPR